MVDLSKVKKGDRGKFRCGGEAVIFNADPIDEDEISLVFEDYGRFSYFPDGRHHEEKILDIVEVTPAPFDWDTVKPGDKFRYTNSNALGRLEFLCLHPYREGLAVCVNLEAPDNHVREVPTDVMKPIKEQS